MTISLFKDGFLSAHLNTRQRLKGSLNLRRCSSPSTPTRR